MDLIRVAMCFPLLQMLREQCAAIQLSYCNALSFLGETFPFAPSGTESDQDLVLERSFLPFLQSCFHLFFMKNSCNIMESGWDTI